MGTMSGGSAMKRRWPSTTVVSLSRACRLSRVLALVTILAVRSAIRLSAFDPVDPALAWRSARRPATSMREYQTSSVDIWAKLAISWR